MTTPPEFDIRPFGECGAIAQFADIGDTIALALHMNRIAETLRAGGDGADCVAGVASVALRADPEAQSLDALMDLLRSACRDTVFDARPEPAQTVELPAVYGGAHGPDLDALCKELSLSRDAFIDAHASILYRVLMIGFAPGFAYLGELPAALRAPRKAIPAKSVAPGSIGVAANMTGIYPARSPGGWRLIGRTPAQLFDVNAAEPFRIAAGDAVRFVPVPDADFDRLPA